MSLLDWVLITQFVVTAYMVGVLWQVQLVHYPMLADLDPACAGEACRRHASRITPVVGIPMLIEFACAAWLIVPGSHPVQSSPLAFVGFGAVLGLWVLTACVQVPQHSRLACQAGAVDRETVAHLVAWNWPRTILWSLRLVIAATLVCWAIADRGMRLDDVGILRRH